MTVAARLPALLVALFVALLVVLQVCTPPSWAGEQAPQPAQAPALTAATYAQVRAMVLPSAQEVAFREVGWRPTFGEAVAEARRTRRPVFLWAMNGHPLACT